MSQETHAAQWLGFRQPVLRVAREKRGETFTATHEANPGEVWEESEFWTALSWRIDPDGSLGIRKHFESPYRPGQPVTMDEYYGWMFENSVPGLPEAAQKEGLTPLAYMRKYGAFKVKDHVYKLHEQPLPADMLRDAVADAEDAIVLKDGAPIGVMADGVACAGFNTPSRRLEFHSKTLVDWGWPEHAVPRYVPGHVHWRDLKREDGRVRSAAEFPAADAHPHALAGEMAVPDLQQQSALDLDARRAPIRRRDGRSGEGAHADRLLRHARLGDRGHSSRHPRDVAPSRTLAAARRAGEPHGVGAGAHRSAGHRLQGVAGARRPAVRQRGSRQRARSGGARSGCTRT